jgi:tetratricopeptide (TPR) repeat protein
MIAQIGRLDPARLGTIARGSSMQYRDRRKDIATVGRELGVDYVIEGSVRRGGDRVRVTVKLVQTSDQTQVWAETYERDLKDVIALQADVARAVARGIQLTLSPRNEARLASAPAVDADAYELFLQGRYFWNKRDHRSLLKSADLFEAAIARQPGHALFHVGLADAYVVLVDQGNVPALVGMPKAKEAADRALVLDPDLAEAHATRAMILGAFEWRWVEAEAGFRRALDLDSNYATAHHWYAHLLRALRRFDDAVRESQRAQALDPLSLIITSNVGSSLFYARRFDEAERQYLRVIAVNPRFAPAHWGLGRSMLETGRVAEAIAHHERAVEVSGREGGYLCTLAHAYAVAGRTADARRLLREVEALARRAYVSPYDRALVHAGLGDKKAALDLLERAVDQRCTGLRQLRIDERLKSLHGEPRFEALCRRVGLS